MKLANSQKVKNSWFRKFLKLTNAPRHLDFFPAAKVENFELERPMINNIVLHSVKFTDIYSYTYVFCQKFRESNVIA